MGPIRTLGDAVFGAEADKIPPITVAHFQKSLGIVRASVPEELLLNFTQWNAKYGAQSR